MSLHQLEPVFHVLGFVVASAIYGMLLWTVGRAGWSRATRLPFAAGMLGLIWNLGRLQDSFGELGLPDAPEFVDAVAYSALGFLPAVVVHAILREEPGRRARILTGIGYALSSVASVAHFMNLFREGFAPSPEGVHAMGPAFAALVVPLIVLTRSQSTWRRALSLFALALFALTGTELAYHSGDSLVFDLLGHHASIPLAFVILYQEYRFALADQFLKRALSFIALFVVSLGGYAAITALGTDLREPLVMASVLVLCVGTALAYRFIAWSVSRLVDRWLLGRDSYARLRARVNATLHDVQTSTEALDRVSKDLALAFNAEEVRWTRVNGDEVEFEGDLSENASLSTKLVPAGEGIWLDARRSSAAVLVPTAEPPRYLWSVARLSEGRVLGADDRVFLEWVALRVARRIDRLRIVHERYEHQIREQEMGKLATEAELKALRAQLDPHFLFNALTTIGYLIQSSPERAMGTLLNLTDLLRRVLRSNDAWSSLGEELDLVSAYLDIEKERFEERLETIIVVPSELRSLRLPPLILQPLVENAVKHGISPAREGGLVAVTVERLDGTVSLRVKDTGSGGAVLPSLSAPSGEGVGLRNVQARLRGYFGADASLTVRRRTGGGTIVELRIPASLVESTSRPSDALAVTEGHE